MRSMHGRGRMAEPGNDGLRKADAAATGRAPLGVPAARLRSRQEGGPRRAAR
jgi:hypothetical protein